MATKNIVPRANGEGGIGTSVKRWLSGFFKNINVDTEAIVPTPANNDNSTKAATTAWVENVFFTKLVAKLLATTAATISSLSTSSLFYRFLAQALSVAGVQYNLSNSSAWYICLGSLFGGLIIQGGSFSMTETFVVKPMPIAFTAFAVGMATNSLHGLMQISCGTNSSNANVYVSRVDTTSITVTWGAIGY